MHGKIDLTRPASNTCRDPGADHVDVKDRTTELVYSRFGPSIMEPVGVDLGYYIRRYARHSAFVVIPGSATSRTREAYTAAVERRISAFAILEGRTATRPLRLGRSERRR
jgi:hypothetical protein